MDMPIWNKSVPVADEKSLPVDLAFLIRFSYLESRESSLHPEEEVIKHETVCVVFSSTKNALRCPGCCSL